jgi:hypothetical protein
LSDELKAVEDALSLALLFVHTLIGPIVYNGRTERFVILVPVLDSRNRGGGTASKLSYRRNRYV